MKRPQALDWNPASSPTFWVNHASRAIMRRFEERLRPLGFGMAYLPVVVALEEQGPLQQKALLEHARIEQPTMTALLARMERDGLIRRKADPTDARARLVSLTPHAESVLTNVKQAMLEVVETALDGVSDKERTLLMKVLQRVVKNLGYSDSAP
jgi:DNA-binding MarR family transcriptional regulator